MMQRMIRQLLSKLLMQGINKGIDLGIGQAAKGRHGATPVGQDADTSPEAQKLQQKRAREMKKRVQDMAKLTRRMR